MSWQTAILAAFVSAVVTAILGPLRASLEEAARHRSAERRKLARLLKAFRFRVTEEERRRRRIAAREGPVPRGDPLRIWDFEAWGWSVLEYDAIAIGAKIAREMRDHLCALMGTWHVEYLETLAEAPKPPSVSGVAERITDSGALNQTLDAPVDKLVQDQSNDLALVPPVIERIDKMLALCARVWWPLW